MLAKHRKPRIPQLKFTPQRGTGYHVSYRDPISGQPRKHRFGLVSRIEAEAAWAKWVDERLNGTTPVTQPKPRLSKLTLPIQPKRQPVEADIVVGSLLHITSSFILFEEARVRLENGPRIRGTITAKQCHTRKKFAQEILQFLNSLYGRGAVGQMMLTDLKMSDVERFNRMLVDSGYSDSQVRKRMQVIESIIKRAGRPEYGQQQLAWNWNSRDKSHGQPDRPVALPTLPQLKLILRKCDAQRTAMVWMAIGCGFGQRDLAAVRVGQFDATSYDCRRGKTGINRYGDTPPMVWKCLQNYLAEVPRPPGELLFKTQQGLPLIHGNCDSVQLWWSRLRDSLGDHGKGLSGFYSLRHLGASEFGSRPGCSIGDIRRWLGHSASSHVADLYMKLVSPERRAVIEWVRKTLKSRRADLRVPR